MKLEQRLRDFTSAFFTENPDINYGGCGVFAAEMGKDLQALGYNTQCTVFTTSLSPTQARKFDLNALRASLIHTDLVEDWEENGINFYHIMLEVEGKGEHFLVDAEDIYPPDKSEYFGAARLGGNIPVDIMEKLANDDSAWNPTFPRRTIPKVRRSIQSFTEDLKNAFL